MDAPKRPAAPVRADGLAAALTAVSLATCCAWVSPAAAQSGLRIPADQLFVQAGAARDAHTLVVGATWSSAWQREWLGGQVQLYWEASFGRWRGKPAPGESRSSAWVTQVGITPVLRWQADGSARWFAEIGIGANLLLPVYRSGDKRFSTAFNFGDHLAVGWRFGESRQHELALRLQHFSNAGIKRPNPGEDFIQLRYGFKL
jgi:lipid A 3-O-deacylase